jgi:hypothetical protein
MSRLSVAALSLAQLWALVKGEGCFLRAGLCICEDADGDTWDLTPLGGDHVVSGPGPSIWDYDYNFNFCDNIATQIPTPPCTFSNTMAYRLEDYAPASSATCLNMGSDVANPAFPQEVTKIDGDASNGVSIKFAISATTSLTVSLVCNELDKGLVTLPAAPGYLLAAVTNWETWYSCPAAQAGGLNWGWPFLIVASVSVALYAGGGVGYNYRKNPGELEHPHAAFWFDFKTQLVSLVSDGVWLSRKTVAENIKPLSFIAPSEIKPSGEEIDNLLAPGDGETSAAGRSSKSSRPDRSKSRKSRDKKEKKKSKGKDKESKSKAEKQLVTAPDGPRITAETERERRDREIKELASVGERVDDIESKEGGVKAPKE